MKSCPQCGNVFTDDSLSYCLQDGTRLRAPGEASRPPAPSPGSGPKPTAVNRAGGQARTAEDFDAAIAPTLEMRATAPTSRPAATAVGRGNAAGREAKDDSESKRTAVIIGLTIVAVLLVALVGIGLALLFRQPGAAHPNPAGTNREGGNTAPVANGTNTPAPPANVNAAAKKPSPTPQANTNAGAPPVPPPKITATASSAREPERGFSYVAENVSDGDPATAWVEGAGGPGVGESVRLDFDREVSVRRIRISPGYFKSPQLWRQNNRLAAATFFFSDGTSRRFTFPDLMEERTLDLGPRPVRTRWVRLRIEDTYPGAVDAEDTPVSELKFDYEP